MATIVTRAGKGSPLTNTEVDANFTNLNTDKLETSGGTLTGNLSFGDNDKAIFGAGSDLQIYHNGTHSYVDDAGTGNLKIRSSGAAIQFQTIAGVDLIYADTSGAVDLYYAGSGKKLATTSTGIDVTGTVTADGADIQGVIENSISGQTVGQYLFRTGSVNGGFGLNYDGINVDDLTRSSWAITTNVATGEASTILDITSRSPGDAAGAGKNRLRIANGGDISFYEDTGTTPKFFWDASAESLGIGTSSPASTCHVVRDIGSATTANYQIASVDLVTTGTPDNDLVASTLYRIKGVEKFRIGGANDGSFRFLSGVTTERMRIDSSGNLLVGLSSSSTAGTHKVIIESASTVGTVSSHLALVGDGATNGEGPQILFSESGDGSSWAGGTIGFVRTGGNSVGDLVFGTRGTTGDINTTTTERMRIDSSGRVGIGTSSPNHKLEIDGAVRIQNTSVTPASGQGLEIGYNPSSGEGFIISRDRTGNTNNYKEFITNGSVLRFGTGTTSLTERMRIDSSGNLFVGISSSAGNRFAVSDDGVRSRLYVTTGGALGSYNLGTGTVTCSSGIIGFSSDERLKIADGVLSNGLQKVMQIVPQYFYWKDKDGNKDQNRPRELGFFAQNIQETCGKEVVADPHREDMFLGIHDRGVMAVLVKAIQEQQAIIEALETRIAALESN